MVPVVAPKGYVAELRFNFESRRWEVFLGLEDRRYGMDLVGVAGSAETRMVPLLDKAEALVKTSVLSRRRMAWELASRVRASLEEN